MWGSESSDGVQVPVRTVVGTRAPGTAWADPLGILYENVEDMMYHRSAASSQDLQFTY